MFTEKLPNLPELKTGNVYRCSICSKKCFFQVQEKELEYINSFEKHKSQELVKLEGENCNRTQFSKLYIVNNINELLEL